MEKETAIHSSILVWRIPWIEEPGRLESIGSHRVRHDLSDLVKYMRIKSTSYRDPPPPTTPGQPGRRCARPEAPPHPRPQGPEAKAVPPLPRRGHGPAGGSRVWRVPGTRRIRVTPAGAMSRNLRTALIFGGFISLIGAAFYPIYFRPLMRLEEYSEKYQALEAHFRRLKAWRSKAESSV
ncbi:hypothetical protein FD755_020166 [Muntiacus reevesi]|uniref:Small integral membrane protein 20 n=1 Tax=Muntiacus reevesi TaxID=9886 RepID=A0A5N3X2R1_MUNRE|nr:hypothetical protein FD755_020166 [Muntiacus reevesi]